MEKETTSSPDQISQAVMATLDILGQPTATALAEALRAYVNLDVEDITTVAKLALFEQGLKLIFHDGANHLIERLDSELKASGYAAGRTREQRTVQNPTRKA